MHELSGLANSMSAVWNTQCSLIECKFYKSSFSPIALIIMDHPQSPTTPSSFKCSVVFNFQQKKDSSASMTADPSRPKQVYVQPPGKGAKPAGSSKTQKKKPEVVSEIFIYKFMLLSELQIQLARLSFRYSCI